MVQQRVEMLNTLISQNSAAVNNSAFTKLYLNKVCGHYWGNNKRELRVLRACGGEELLLWLTLTSMTLVIFHRSIRRPMKTLTCTTKLVSLSKMYNSTTRDWKTPNMMERTDSPSRDCLLFQNWISEEEMVEGQPEKTSIATTLCCQTQKQNSLYFLNLIDYNYSKT